MNIRLQNNALRFRISQSEMQQLLNGELLQTSTPLPNLTPFTYRICLDNHNDTLNLKTEAGLLKLQVPVADAQALAQTGRCREGITSEQTLDNGDHLQLSLQIDIRKHRPE